MVKWEEGDYGGEREENDDGGDNWDGIGREEKQ